MINRIRESLDGTDEGFTVVELLVVIAVMGILAAIAIPIFLNQRKTAVDAGIKSDLRMVATHAETYFTDNQTYVAAAANAVGTPSITYGGTAIALSSGNVISVVVNAGADAYCMFGINAKGTGVATGFSYVSNGGGLKSGPSAATKCGAAGGAW